VTPELTRRLERLKNRSTLYECIAVNGERTVLLFYGDKNQAGFRRWLRRDNQSYAQRLVDLTGSKTIDWADKPFRGTIGTIGEWTIKFSGRTQREALIAGEHVFVMDV
jgi:hypothetical protein